MSQGYFSLIQYCPDWTRLEVCNLGVMLFCSEPQFLDVAMTRRYATRIHKIFGRDHSLEHVKMFKDIFAERIRVEKSRLCNLEALKSFIAKRANSFLITEPRSIDVRDPARELADLFKEIFGETTKSESKKRVSTKERFYQALEMALGADLDRRVVRNLPQMEVPVPGFHRTIRPCAGYLNGSFNIVVSERLTPENSFTKMSCNLIAGKFFRETPSKYWGTQRLVILAETNHSAEVEEQVETFRPMMEDQNIGIYTDHGQIVATIKQEAKPLTPEVLEHIQNPAL